MKKAFLFGCIMAIAGVPAIAQKKVAATDKKVTTKSTAQAVKYATTPGGVQYYIVKHGNGQKANIGDQLTIHINTHIGDSALFNSRKMNNDEPVPLPLQAPAFHGDISEVFAMCAAGDSLLMRVPLDSMLKAGAQALPWMKKGEGQMIEYEVSIESVKTQDQVRREAAEHSSQQAFKDEQLIQEYLKTHNIQAQKTASGLYYKIDAPGNGASAQSGQQVTVNYTGKTMDGNTFDSNVDPAFGHVQPFSFDLGQGRVIKGWDEGVAMLKKGSKATFYIPSALAYGPQSPSPKIPANSVLIFDVEVTEVGTPAPAETPKPAEVKKLKTSKQK